MIHLKLELGLAFSIYSRDVSYYLHYSHVNESVELHEAVEAIWTTFLQKTVFELGLGKWVEFQ